jgi:hypothetical protein
MAKTLQYGEYDRYKDAIAKLPLKERLEPKHLLKPRFRIERSGDVEIYYAPVDYLNREAQIALVGITPGWQQMEVAYRVAREAIQKGLGRVAVCRRTKKAAAFSGAMRKNLLEMLDGIGVPKSLGIQSSGDLFESEHRLIHSTSILKYPVFVNRENYTGHRPALLNHPLLKHYVKDVFSVEICLLPRAFIIPLGKAVSSALEYLIQKGELSGDRCCIGFPHPSPANGHRKSQFQAERRIMTKKLHKWINL